MSDNPPSAFKTKCPKCKKAKIWRPGNPKTCECGESLVALKEQQASLFAQTT